MGSSSPSVHSSSRSAQSDGIIHSAVQRQLTSGLGHAFATQRSTALDLAWAATGALVTQVDSQAFSPLQTCWQRRISRHDVGVAIVMRGAASDTLVGVGSGLELVAHPRATAAPKSQARPVMSASIDGEPPRGPAPVPRSPRRPDVLRRHDPDHSRTRWTICRRQQEPACPLWHRERPSTAGATT